MDKELLKADIELLEGSFNLSFSSRSKTVMDDEMINHLFNILGKTVKDMEILSLKYLPITDIGCSKIGLV